MNTLNIRVTVVIAVFVLLATAMGSRLVFLHVVDHEFLQGQGDARSIRAERINAHRGMVRDHTGKPLAVSTPVTSLWANPAELLANPENLPLVAAIFDVPLQKFEKRIQENSQRTFVYLRRQMPPQLAEKILEKKIKGVYSQKEYQRYYPAGEIAAHVVGFTNINDEGQEGIELAFNDWLRGEPGKKKVLKNLYGDVVRDIRPMVDAVAGKNLDLSIDLRLQYLAYRELKSAIQFHGAKSGSFVILDAKTGQILSLVNQPSYNPNNRIGLELASIRNRAVTDVFEPGSTVKPFTVAVALESGQYEPGSEIDTSPGFVRVGKKTIPDPRNLGVLDLGGIIAYSSQVGITKLALTLDEYEVWSMFSELGFGQPVGIGFPGESAGYLPNRRRWKDIERVTFAYGYGFQVTPLQLAAAYQVIASGGIKRELSLVKGEVGEGHRVMSEKTAEALKVMLSRVINEGTGSRASIEDYSVAGKTGTVRKVGASGYEDTRHMAFFAGMTPVDGTRLVGVVMINEPSGKEYGGGAIAAPVFAKVMKEALRLLNIPPVDEVTS
ncbi:MAG: cell division protein FtsI (penicillin-binding protein 3) [Candidatus Azotimanducaceae bacterium]|jgi:cell division protein FtsI (penicillin-binding protein 3)